MWLRLLLFFLFLVLGLFILYQDLKQRLISLWLLILYALVCICSVWLLQDIHTLLANGISALIYFSLVFGVLLLYYFLKEKHFSNPINTKIGLADMILLFAVGLTLDIQQLVLFFSAFFLISALSGIFWFNRKGQSVPLAGILTGIYALYYFVMQCLI